jgi:hypothetical protein
MSETTTRSELFEALTIARSDCTFLAPTALASGGNIELTNDDLTGRFAYGLPPCIPKIPATHVRSPALIPKTPATYVLLFLRERIEVRANCVVEQWPKETLAFHLCE